MRSDLTYRKELLVLNGEMLRLKLRHEMNMSRHPAGLANLGWQIISSGSKGRILMGLLNKTVPNQRLRSVFKTALRTVLVWEVPRRVWSRR